MHVKNPLVFLNKHFISMKFQRGFGFNSNFLCNNLDIVCGF